MNRNIKDVLAQLREWHNMLLNRWEVGMIGENRTGLARGFSGWDTKALNMKIREAHRNHELAEIRKDLEATPAKAQSIMEGHLQEELFEKKRFTWTGSSSLGTYSCANTPEHYKGTLKLIRRATLHGKEALHLFAVA